MNFQLLICRCTIKTHLNTFKFITAHMLRKIRCLYFPSLSRQEPNGTAEINLPSKILREAVNCDGKLNCDSVFKTTNLLDL